MRTSKNLKKYRKPTLISTIVKDVLGLVVLGGVITFLYWVYYYSHWFPIRNFNVSAATGSLEYVAPQEISTLLEPYKIGVNFLNINLNKIKQTFEQKDWIYHTEVERAWPDTINIIIFERKPLAYWDTKPSYLVDDKGNLFKGKLNQSLVHFKGAPNTQKMIFDLYQKINPLLSRSPLKLNTIEYTRRSTWILYVNDGVRIFLGREQIINRLSLLLSVWNSLLASDNREISEIHMEYREGFSVKY